MYKKNISIVADVILQKRYTMDVYTFFIGPLLFEILPLLLWLVPFLFEIVVAV